MLDKPPQKTQYIPPLFVEIMENDRRLRITKAKSVIDMTEFRPQRARQLDMRKHAELMLAGTKDKGKKF